MSKINISSSKQLPNPVTQPNKEDEVRKETGENSTGSVGSIFENITRNRSAAVMTAALELPKLPDPTDTISSSDVKIGWSQAPLGRILPGVGEDIIRKTKFKPMPPGYSSFLDPDRSYGLRAGVFSRYASKCGNAEDFANYYLSETTSPVTRAIVQDVAIGIAGVTVAPASAIKDAGKSLASVWFAWWETAKAWNGKLKVCEKRVEDIDKKTQPPELKRLNAAILELGQRRHNLGQNENLSIIILQEKLLAKINDAVNGAVNARNKQKSLLEKAKIKFNKFFTSKEIGQFYSQAKTTGFEFESPSIATSNITDPELQRLVNSTITKEVIGVPFSNALAMAGKTLSTSAQYTSAVLTTALVFTVASRLTRLLGESYQTISHGERMRLEADFEDAKKMLKRLDRENLTGCALFLAAEVSKNTKLVTFEPRLAQKQIELNALICDLISDWLLQEQSSTENKNKEGKIL